MKRVPTFRKMTGRESRALLQRNGIGRLAFTFKDHVDIEPIGYVLDGSWLYCRTSRGTKLVQLKHNPWVAFEADEVAGPFDWQSVVVHGTVYFLNPGGQEHEDFGHALALFRRRDPRVLRGDDFVPARTILFRIHVDEVTGRMATTKVTKVRVTRARASRRG